MATYYTSITRSAVQAPNSLLHRLLLPYLLHAQLHPSARGPMLEQTGMLREIAPWNRDGTMTPGTMW